MLKTGLSAALLVTAAAVQAQPANTPPPTTTVTTPVPPSAPAQPPQQQIVPPPAFFQVAQAFGQCVQGAIGQLPATATPEAGAAQALAACTAQKSAMETQFEAWVASDAFPAEGRDTARQQFSSQLGQAEVQIAQEIRQRRAGPAAPAPAPTPSN